MATHSSTLAWRIPWREEPGTVHEVAKSRTQLSDFTSQDSEFFKHSDSASSIHRAVRMPTTVATDTICKVFKCRTNKTENTTLSLDQGKKVTGSENLSLA